LSKRSCASSWGMVFLDRERRLCKLTNDGLFQNVQEDQPDRKRRPSWNHGQARRKVAGRLTTHRWGDGDEALHPLFRSSSSPVGCMGNTTGGRGAGARSNPPSPAAGQPLSQPPSRRQFRGHQLLRSRSPSDRLRQFHQLPAAASQHGGNAGNHRDTRDNRSTHHGASRPVPEYFSLLPWENRVYFAYWVCSASIKWPGP
jgi:hypothetical protein